MGTRLPFAETAMGRAIWCSASPGMQAVVARRLQAQDPERWPARAAGLQRAEVDWAERGYAVSESEWESEIAAIGVGLDLGDGREPLALTVGGPASRLQGALLHDDFGPALVKTGRDIVAAIQAAGWED